jgi:hypothetical protein
VLEGIAVKNGVHLRHESGSHRGQGFVDPHNVTLYVILAGVVGAIIVIAPLIGLVAAFAMMTAVYWLFRESTPLKMDSWFRKLPPIWVILSAHAALPSGHSSEGRGSPPRWESGSRN